MDRRHRQAVIALWLAAAGPSAAGAQTQTAPSSEALAVLATRQQGGQQPTPPAAPGQGSARPQEPADPDGALSQLVAEALLNNPDILGAAEAIAAARTRPAQARSLADPVVTVQYTNDGWAPTLGEMAMTTLAFMGSQTLPWPGKRGLRDAVAATDVAQAKERVERARLTVAAAVKRAYWAPGARARDAGAARRAGPGLERGGGRGPRPLRGRPGCATGRAARAVRDHALRATPRRAGGASSSRVRRS